MLAISLTIACSRYTYDGVILHAHPVRGESRNQPNANGEVATLPETRCFKLTEAAVGHGQWVFVMNVAPHI